MGEITWRKNAFDQMDRLIRRYPQLRQDFALALKAINHILLASAATAGESRDRHERILIIEPLAIRFAVNHSGQRVAILSVNLSTNKK